MRKVFKENKAQPVHKAFKAFKAFKVSVDSMAGLLTKAYGPKPKHIKAEISCSGTTKCGPSYACRDRLVDKAFLMVLPKPIL